MSIARFYNSTDSGAPQLSGQAGSMKDLLRALTVGSSGVAYGTGSGEKASLGWSVLFESSTKMIIRGGPGGSQVAVRIDDSGSGAGSFREAFVFGVEGASDVDTFSSRFPTTVQLSSGLVWRKSQTLSSTPVPWWAWGDDKTFYIMVNWYGGIFAALYWFGDFKSIVPGDAFNFVVSGGRSVNDSNNIPAVLDACSTSAGSQFSYVARSYDQAVKSLNIGFHWPFCDQSAGKTVGNLIFSMGYPSPINSGLVCAPVVAFENGKPRGILRGLHCPMHNTGITDWTSNTGVSGFPGATLTLTGTYNNSGTGRVVAEHGAEFT